MFSQSTEDQIKQVLRDHIEHHDIAGANVLVIQGGKEIFYHEDGYADLEKGLPIKRDTIFRMFSMTKAVTAAAVMTLLESGAMDLYDPVSRYLPGFKNQRVEDEKGNLVPVNREMTLKDLLSMTSGLVYAGENKAGKETTALFQELDQRLLGDSPMGTQEAMNRLGQCTLAFHPGSNWEYGTSADVLGAVVEVISGKSYGEFLKEKFFEPLGMTDTGFYLPEEKRTRLAKAYKDNGKGGLEHYTGNNLGIINLMDRKPAFESGGAGLVSTIDDYSKFATMLMQGGSLGGHQVLRPRTVKYLRSATLNEDQQKGFDKWLTFCGHSYGNLMRVMVDSGRAGDIGHNGEYGWDGWLGVYFCNCPQDDLTFLMMMQKVDAGTTRMTRKLRNIILSSCCE